MNDVVSLINQIQVEIVNDACTLESILLKSQVLSDLLESNELQEWVNNELNGYFEKNSLPDYRIINAGIAGEYFNGAYLYSNMPVSTILLPIDLQESVEKAYISQGIFSLQEMSKNEFNHLSLPDGWLELYNIYAKTNGYKLVKASLPIPGSAMSQILGATRSRLLKFILKIRKIHWNEEQSTSILEQVTQVFNLTIYNTGELNMSSPKSTSGDTYINHGQAGSIGANSQASNMSFQQVWLQNKESIDLKALAEELFTLRTAMKDQAEDSSQDRAVAEISSAQEAAKIDDGTAVIKHLKKAGQWALDVASKIGVSLAADTIKKALDTHQ
jgi:AbiTii